MGERHPFTADARNVYHRLMDWVDELDTLTGLYDDRGFAPIEKRQKAHVIYMNVKEGLRAEHKQMSTLSGRAELTPAEEHWYERVVHKASNHMRAPLRSKPEKYYRHALETRMDLTQAIVGMKDYYDIPEEQ